METNAWAWWQQALENPKDIGRKLPVSPDSPEQGFYRARYKGKPWEPVAIWHDIDWIALRSGRSVDAREVWSYCCRNPISAEDYEQALDGGGWTDDDPTVASMIGHNVGEADEAIMLADQIASAKQGAEAYRDLHSEAEAAKAQSLRARMNELAGKADKRREELKEPHLKAGKAVDAIWMPLVKDAKAVADLIRKYIEDFKTAQLREQRRLEAERRQREEAEALKSGEEAAPPPLPTVEPTIKGNYGRAATVSAKFVVTQITDVDALFAVLKGEPVLHDLMLKLAQKRVDLGQTVPGVTIIEQARIS
jgi:hypothetical protein